jgi:hypothetical protein
VRSGFEMSHLTIFLICVPLSDVVKSLSSLGVAVAREVISFVASDAGEVKFVRSFLTYAWKVREQGWMSMSF